MSDEKKVGQVSDAIKKLQVQTEVAYKEFENILDLLAPVVSPLSSDAVVAIGMKFVPCALKCALAETIDSITSQLQNLTNRIVYTNGRIEL